MRAPREPKCDAEDRCEKRLRKIAKAKPMAEPKK